MATSYTLALVFSAGVFFAAWRGKKNAFLSDKTVHFLVGTVFFLALALRLIMGYTLVGFTSDIALFKEWGQLTNKVGFDLIYRQNIFLDYPPGYLYILTLLDKLRLLFGLEIESAAYTLIIKMPAILADLFCGAVLWHIASRKLDKFTAAFITAAYLFCPPVLLNSADWGQVDSFCLAFFLIAMLLLWREQYVFAGAIYGLSIILKPQMLTFVPIFILFVIRKKSWRSLILAPLTALGVMALVALPFTRNFNYLWLIEQYKKTMGGYPYYSINAYNIWSLVGLNWKDLPSSNVISLLMTLVGPAIATFVCSLFMLRAKRDEVLFAAPVIIMSIAYILTVQMHERYVFPVLLFILLTYILVRDRRILYGFAGVSVVHFMNVKHVLRLYGTYSGKYDPNALEVKIFSILQILAFTYLLFVFYDIFAKNHVIEAQRKTPKQFFSAMAVAVQETVKKQIVAITKESSIFTAKDWFVVGVITIAYAVVGFWHLGSHTMALSAWTPQQGESVIIETKNLADTICFVPGLVPDANHYAAKIGMNVNVETSIDGKTWAEEGTLQATGVFEWRQQKLKHAGKYFRFTALDDRTVINEIGIKNSAWDNYEILTAKEGNASALMDEQHIIPLHPTYYDSTYFDEIYHARTAYENIYELEPYENTHPPLGKYLIALGIQLFGMNPFGWRFMGAFFGVLMLPALYYLLKQLFSGTFWPSVGTILFALDFMHFTQTRIATIDTYAVFFILVMYSAMVAFMKKDIYRATIKSLRKPLAICGVFMGIGIASKWTVAYGAIGLAVLLFVRMGRAIYTTPRGEKKQCLQKCGEICLWCVLFFIAIPFVIYFVAFLPLTTLPHQTSVWQTFINYQVNMFNYHSQLKAEHFFASPWYEWPLIIKPIWFFYADRTAKAGMVSTISSFGNPAVWWVGLPAMLLAVVCLIRKKSLGALVAITGFLSVYLPWVLVPRISFIYHYFTAIPFLIIAVVLVLRSLDKSKRFSRSLTSPKGVCTLTPIRVVAIVYMAVALMLFIVFLPVISGLPAAYAHLKELQWLPQWYFVG